MMDIILIDKLRYKSSVVPRVGEVVVSLQLEEEWLIEKVEHIISFNSITQTHYCDLVECKVAKGE